MNARQHFITIIVGERLQFIEVFKRVFAVEVGIVGVPTCIRDVPRVDVHAGECLQICFHRKGLLTIDLTSDPTTTDIEYVTLNS